LPKPVDWKIENGCETVAKCEWEGGAPVRQWTATPHEKIMGCVESSVESSLHFVHFVHFGDINEDGSPFLGAGMSRQSSFQSINESS